VGELSTYAYFAMRCSQHQFHFDRDSSRKATWPHSRISFFSRRHKRMPSPSKAGIEFPRKFRIFPYGFYLRPPINSAIRAMMKRGFRSLRSQRIIIKMDRREAVEHLFIGCTSLLFPFPFAEFNIRSRRKISQSIERSPVVVDYFESFNGQLTAAGNSAVLSSMKSWAGN